MTILTTRQAKGAGFLAAQQMYKAKRLYAVAEVYALTHFGDKPDRREIALNRAISTGWLAKTPQGMMHLTSAAIEYFDGIEVPTPKYVGQVAAPREQLHDANAWPTLSRKHLTNSRGDHARVVDDRFQRAEGTQFYGVHGRMG